MNRPTPLLATLALGLFGGCHAEVYSLAAFSFFGEIAAQGTVETRYSISGSIIDQTEAFVPKAEVVLVEEARRKKHKTRSDGAGRFRFEELPSGEYLLEVGLPGFTPAKSTVTLAGENVSQDVHLEVGGISETVVITRGQIVIPARESRTYPRREAPVCERATERPIGGHILPPIKIRDVRPTYPGRLKNAGLRSHFVVRARVGADGRVSDLVVVGPAREEFADSARRAIGQWLFDPIYLNCQPMPARLTVFIEFTEGW